MEASITGILWEPTGNRMVRIFDMGDGSLRRGHTDPTNCYVPDLTIIININLSSAPVFSKLNTHEEPMYIR